jgi:glycosyltransferase involved in cell wall biosynthesis
MKILQLHSPYRVLGGEDTVAANEARLLRAAGHEVWQFFEPNPADPLRTAGATLAAPWNPLSAAQLRDRLRAELPDVAHVHNTWFRLSPSIYRTLADHGVAVVRTLHNFRTFCLQGQTYRDGHACLDCLDRPSSGMRHGCYRGHALSLVAAATQRVQERSSVLDAIDRFVAPSEFVRTLVVRAGIPAERTVVKPHFTFDPGHRPAPPSSSHDVLVVGRLAPGKGVDLLLEAWGGLTGQTGLRLEVLGSGPLSHELAAAAPAGVEFAAVTHHEVLHRMLTARAVVVPSMLNETFGLVALEAMAAGLPVAGFRSGAIGEVLAEQSALLSEPGDIEALRGALERLADDALVDLIGEANRQRFLRRYSPEAQLPMIEELYATAAHHGE